MSNSEKKNKKSMIIIIILVLLLAITVAVSIWALFFRETTPDLAPDYAPQQTEENAEKIEDDDSEKLPQQEGGGAVSLTYSKNVSIDLSEKKASILFANPQKSNQNMLLQIVIKDTVIAQSGILGPGYKVNELKLKDKVKLSAGEYEGKFVVSYYQQEDGEKAMINTEIPLTVKVSE